MGGLRILHVLAERGWSGGEEQLRALLAHLKARGHDNLVVLDPRAAFAGAARALDLEIHEVAMRNDLDAAAVLGLARLFRRLRPDLIHFACSRAHKLGAAAALGLPRPPQRVAVRRMDYPLPATPFRRWLYGRAVDAVVAVSAAVAGEIARIGVPEAKITVIPDGVDVAGLRAAAGDPARLRKELALPERAQVGLTVASLHRRKGWDVLLAALRRLAPRPERPLVWLGAGEGPLAEELEKGAAALPAGVEFRLLGRRPAAPLLALADLFVLPSRREGLGVALLEAMAFGLPVVGTRTGGMPEAVEDGRSGLLVPPGDSGALARAIERLLEDPDGARRLGAEAAQRVARRFALERMCRDSEALYLRLTGRG